MNTFSPISSAAPGADVATGRIRGVVRVGDSPTLRGVGFSSRASIRVPGRRLGAASRRARLGGFSLVELLVAMAVFGTVMAGVTLLFVSSVRSVKQGTQNIDAFSTARATFDVIDRDLTTAFTSRDRGDYYNFFGTPIGFTFIGVVDSSGFSGAGGDNLARITYVLHRSDGADGTQVTSQSFAPDNPINKPLNRDTVPTYALIRYVEPNVNSLDDFPVPWDSLTVADSPSPTSPQVTLYNWVQSHYGGGLSLLDPARRAVVEQELVRSLKRELWIQMLAGDPTLPHAWAYKDTLGNTQPGFLYKLQRDPATGQVIRDTNGNPVRVPMVASDYVISDGIILEVNDNNPVSSAISDNLPTEFLYSPKGFPNLKPLFTYGGLEQAQEVAPHESYWNALKNLVVDPVTLSAMTPAKLEQTLRSLMTANGSVVKPRIPALVGVRLQWMFPSPYPGAPDFKRAFDETIDIPTGYTRQDLTKSL